MFFFFSSMSQHSNLGTQSTCSLPPPFWAGQEHHAHSSAPFDGTQGHTGGPGGNWKYKRKLEQADLYMQVLQEESRNCPVFPKKQLGVTARRHQEHQYAPKASCAFWGWKYPVTDAVNNPNQTHQHHELQDREPTTYVVMESAEAWVPFLLPKTRRPRSAKYSKHREVSCFWAHDFRISLCGKQCWTALLFQPGGKFILQSKSGKWGELFFKAWTIWELCAVSVINSIWSESQLDLHC